MSLIFLACVSTVAQSDIQPLLLERYLIMALWEETAQKITLKIQRRKISAEEVTQSALDRLASVNPSINAVVDRFDQDALHEAQQIDAKLNAGKTVGILAGVPVTVKVNVDQIGRATTNGVRIQKDQIAQKDNPVVANLRRAGAIIIGRTNTPAFHFDSLHAIPFTVILKIH